MRLGLFDVSRQWPRQRTWGNDRTSFHEQQNFSLSSVQFVGLILPSNSHAEIWTRLHNFFRYLAIGMCHFRHLWNGMCDRHRAEITVMQFTGHSLPVHHFVTAWWDFLPCLILSAELYFTDGAIIAIYLSLPASNWWQFKMWVAFLPHTV